jgi:hypothetical protein
MNQKNLNKLQQKISRAQAVLEQTGELTLSHEDQSIQILQVEFEGAIGWKVGNQIHSDSDEAISAARKAIGDTFGNQIQVVANMGVQLGTSILSMGLAKLAFVCVSGAERLNKIR